MSIHKMQAFLAVIMLGMVGCGSGTTSPPADNGGNNGGSEPECSSNADCGDGQFCNGVEICDEGECFLGDRPCGNIECDESRNECVVDDDPLPIQCGIGASPSINEPGVCCPNGFPYVAFDGRCYISEAQGTLAAKMYTDCANWFSVEEVQQVGLTYEGFRQEGDSLNDSLSLALDSCIDVCGNDAGCEDACVTCNYAIVSFVYSN